MNSTTRSEAGSFRRFGDDTPPEKCTFVSFDFIDDPRLSLNAIGLLAHIGRHGPEVVTSVKSIARKTLQGEHSITTAIGELEKLGYLTRTRQAGLGGGVSYVIAEQFVQSGSSDPGPYPRVLQRRERSSSGCAYAISAGEEKPVKIGKSDDPTKRLKELQTSHHEELHLIWQAPGGHALEAHLHEVFADRHIRGEWFDFTGTNATHLITDAATAWKGTSR